MYIRFHQCNIKPAFAYVNKMHKHSKTFIFPQVPRKANVGLTPPHLRCSIMLVFERQETLLAPPHATPPYQGQDITHNIEVYNRKT